MSSRTMKRWGKFAFSSLHHRSKESQAHRFTANRCDSQVSGEQTVTLTYLYLPDPYLREKDSKKQTQLEKFSLQQSKFGEKMREPEHRHQEIMGEYRQLLNRDERYL